LIRAEASGSEVFVFVRQLCFDPGIVIFFVAFLKARRKVPETAWIRPRTREDPLLVGQDVVDDFVGKFFSTSPISR
jgi:hypothetical protein